MDQLSTLGIPKRRFGNVDLEYVCIALKLKFDCFPISLEVAITVIGCQLDAIACATGRRGSVFPGGYDHCKDLMIKDVVSRILKKWGLNKMIFVIFLPILAKLETASLKTNSASPSFINLLHRLSGEP
jgi:hypothetical protein